jgi:hypothetical protein
MPVRDPISIHHPRFLALSESRTGLLMGVNLFRSRRFKIAFEAAIWMAGLLAVGLPDPALPSAIDLCLFKAIGLPGCPGCGLGHAMGYLFRAEWALALQSHWFSPVVLIILLTRIVSLIRQAVRPSN